ncbi:transposase [Phormidium sp. LEGE 05292]|uniref:transposase n=1 Tax=[Phormidium] sp. LEGE 05292 TaxID=767427 RepID=UPI001882D72D|nr:transposase [Phormidium sp. LEGE 05292]MBE9228300.1 transposase [Phormidium sp. LEGE 05292]
MRDSRFKDKYKSESIRLKHYNYSTNGWYFVTICTYQKLCFLGDAIANQIQLTAIGKIAEEFWLNIPIHFKYTYLDAYVIMPNHIHGIIIIARPKCRNVACNVSTTTTPLTNERKTADDNHNISQAMSEISPKAGSLSVIMRSYKSAVNRWCHINGYESFAWQPRFYDHVIRNSIALERIRKYIINNPAKWENECKNPENLWM